MLTAAKDGDRVSVLIKYRPGVRPSEAREAYGAIDGLTVKTGFIPALTVEGDTSVVGAAIDHELTIGAVKDFQDYRRYLSPSSSAARTSDSAPQGTAQAPGDGEDHPVTTGRGSGYGGRR
jgi:hypothetical protein